MNVLTPVHLDVKEVDQKGTFTGYAAVFNNEDRGGDIIMPGAFTKSLRERPAERVKMLFGHDRTQPVGKWISFKEDAKGLLGTGQILTSIQKGAEVLEMMREGIIDSLSIGYQTVIAQYDEKTNVRRLMEVALWEVSTVIFPMNEAATITDVKNTDLTKRDLERILRDAGVANSFAKSIVSCGFDEAKHLLSNGRRDADTGQQSDHELKETLTRAIKLMQKEIDT